MAVAWDPDPLDHDVEAAYQSVAAFTFAEVENSNDQIVTSAQGKQEDSKVLEGTRVRGRVARL
jgi:hypothetical protein